MAEEMHPPPPQQQQQQQQPQQPQQQQPQQKPRINLQELRNSDLISRYLAATPPYLYASPTAPHNFFFSEMLRSLVQARTNEQNNRNQTVTASSQSGRRPRKRAWSQHRTSMLDAPTALPKDFDKQIHSIAVEKPLELTNKNGTYPISKYQKCESPPKAMLPTENSVKSQRIEHLDIKNNMPLPHYQTNTEITPISSAEQTSIPPSDLVLPPPPPMWYPPLYPPYGIDPLHFFIDLRVSGHIYDRKKENISPSDNNNVTTTLETAEPLGKHRHGSAFSVPPPRRDKSPASALNLTSVTSMEKQSIDYNNHYLDHLHHSAKDNSAKNTNYVLQNLPRIYTNLTTTHADERNLTFSSARTTPTTPESKSESDVQEVVEPKRTRLDTVAENRDYDDSSDVVIVDQKTEMDENY